MAGVVISGSLGLLVLDDNERPLPSLFLYLFSEAGLTQYTYDYIGFEAHANVSALPSLSLSGVSVVCIGVGVLGCVWLAVVGWLLLSCRCANSGG